MTGDRTYKEKHKKYYLVNKEKAIISTIKNKYKISPKSANRIYTINQEIKKIRSSVKKYYLDPQYGKLMIEKTQLMYKGIIL